MRLKANKTSLYNWVWRLHEADMCAAHIDERGTDE